MNTYQTIVIGAGSGGLTVAIGLAALGRKVALVEGRFVGGDCTNVGCVPSKTLIHLVNEHEGRLAPDDILARVQERRNALRDTETEHVGHTENLELILGWASFSGPKTLDVQLNDGTRRQLSADNIVIATGSRPRHLDIAGLPVDRTLTNESLFEQETAPRHLAIIGSGVIAMEMAFAFHKLGSQVTVITRSARVLSPNIPEASQALHNALCERGIQVHYRATPSSYDEASETLHINSGDMPVAVGNVDRVLLAVGRVRNIDKLGLEHSGVKVDAKRGILVNAWGETTLPGVYAIGDVTPTSHFTHSANAQGRRVVQRIAFPFLPARGPEPLFPSATFSDPEVASVGMTPEEIGARFHPELIKRIRIDLKDVDRGYTDYVQQGFIIVDAIRLSGRILGVTIVGPRASEMLSFFTMAITANISLYKIYKLVYPYPTFSNAVGKVADTFMRETLPTIKRELPAYLRYRFAAPPQSGASQRATSGD
jgi:dihydrolipoamide dehydrogenase